MKSNPGSALRLLLCAFALLLPATALYPQKPDALAAGAYATIHHANVYEYCRTLASPKFAGRLTGTQGYDDAARWAAEQFRSWGLKAFDPKHGYLQPFPMQVTVIERAAMTLTLPAGTEMKLQPGRDFLPLFFSDSRSHAGRLVFVGWGISAPELGYDDYHGIDVRDAFALCYRGTPDASDNRYLDHDQHRTRMRVAREKGALGVIYIYDEPIANPNGDWIAGFTPAVIGQKVADEIFKERNLPSAQLRSDLTRYKRPISFPTKTTARLEVESRHKPDGTGFNILGLIEGSDRALKNEYVIVGAHADHCGTLQDLHFPGANDNASGTAVAMEIGRALAAMAQKPKRSVLIALFGAEESGLKGSRYLAANLPAALGKPVAMLNFDMAGEGDGLRCGYSPEPPELKKILEDADKLVRILRAANPIRGIGVQGSDHAPFFEKGIPVLYFSSNGPHLAYHQTGDTIYRVNPDMMADSARLGFLAAVMLADR